jgi:hypothetical protein
VAQLPEEDDLAPSLEQQQVVKGEEEAAAGLMDGADHAAARGHDVLDAGDHTLGRAAVQAGGGLICGSNEGIRLNVYFPLGNA